MLGTILCLQANYDEVTFPDHPTLAAFITEIDTCLESQWYCDEHVYNISSMAARIANDLSSVHLDAVAITFLENTVKSLPECALRIRLQHWQQALYFRVGDTARAQTLAATMTLINKIDMLSLRSRATQSVLLGSDNGLKIILQYTSMLSQRFNDILKNNHIDSIIFNDTDSGDVDSSILSLLLNEAQGAVSLRIPLTDLMLRTLNMKTFSSHQRFYLAVSLAKLGLYDLSLRHVSFIATPWDAPLYTLRAKLIFNPVHSSIRSLAKSVDNFLSNGEAILLRKATLTSPLMAPLCNSFNDASLALQALPLLHLAGYSSPRDNLVIGQSPIALPQLLSEVFTSMCAVSAPSPHLTQMNEDMSKPKVNVAYNRTLRIGIVSGSFDGMIGRLVIGLIESLTPAERQEVKFIAICFPTPRDRLTDYATRVFDQHVNLPSNNKSEAVERIRAIAPDIILFSDAGLDSRVFTLAHERMALFQGALFGYGNTIGIPSVDFYIVPEVFYSESRCSQLDGKHLLPQELFAEQVILLEGIPSFYNFPRSIVTDISGLLSSRFLVPDLSDVHIYLFPGTVITWHPEFDPVIIRLLQNDPYALIILTVPRAGRDNLPTTHPAIRHDLLHPSNAAAAIQKFMQRLRLSIGDEIQRIRVLPPLDHSIYQSLLESAVAVLDPFPVGLHEPILHALKSGVPIVSGPSLQECTNSHSYSLSKAMIDKTRFANIPWATSIDEYVEICLRLQKDRVLRSHYQQGYHTPLGTNVSHGVQLIRFLRSLI